MKKVVIGISICLIAFPISIEASTVTEIIIGSEKISIPAPKGYIDVTHTKPELVDFFKSFVPPGNNLKVLLISTEDERALYPDYERYLIVQTAKSIESQKISTSEFSKLRQEVRDQKKEFFDKAMGFLDKNMPQAAQDFNMKIGETKYIPFESESENHIAFSSISKVSFRIENEKTEEIVACTNAFILAKNHIMFIYVSSVYRTIDDLKWTQNIIDRWIAAIIRANPNAFSLPSSLQAFDWDKIVGKGIAAAIIVLIFSIFKIHKSEPNKETTNSYFNTRR